MSENYMPPELAAYATLDCCDPFKLSDACEVNKLTQRLPRPLPAMFLQTLSCALMDEQPSVFGSYHFYGPATREAIHALRLLILDDGTQQDKLALAHALVNGFSALEQTIGEQHNAI